jgi:hypothetical protein
MEFDKLSWSMCSNSWLVVNWGYCRHQNWVWSNNGLCQLGCVLQFGVSIVSRDPTRLLQNREIVRFRYHVPLVFISIFLIRCSGGGYRRSPSVVRKWDQCLAVLFGWTNMIKQIIKILFRHRFISLYIFYIYLYCIRPYLVSTSSDRLHVVLNNFKYWKTATATDYEPEKTATAVRSDLVVVFFRLRGSDLQTLHQ